MQSMDQFFVAGAAVQWLRDGLGIIDDAAAKQELAQGADSSQNVILVPAFLGLGAPYWNSECRGAVNGLTRATGPAEMAKAALESVGFQTRDLLDAMAEDWQADGVKPTLRVDGGTLASDWAMQFLSDIIAAPVDRSRSLETTALGAAWLVGMHAGVYPIQEEFAARWSLEKKFEPSMDEGVRGKRCELWRKAVLATLSV